MTLPKAVRDRLGLRAGDHFDVWIDDGRIVMAPRALRLDEVCSTLPPPNKAVSIRRMDEAISARANDE